MTNTKLLNQYFTPRWVAEAIVDHHFSDLPVGARGIEPSCGDGRFLMAIPDYIDITGVEIDPIQAHRARELSGREVITGDFLQVQLPEDIDFVIGNPPFVASSVAAFLDRSHALLREEGRCGLILPSYILQTSSKVVAFSKNWSISTEMLPRNLFPGLSLPLTFTVFTKNRARKLFGFFLYRETADITKLHPQIRQVLNSATSRGSVWRQAVNKAFDRLGTDHAPLSAIYEAVHHRPSANAHCEQQIRKVLQTYREFAPVARGIWSRQACNESHQALAA